MLGNAVKFTQKGEVVLDVRPTRDNEKFTLLKFSVKDTGIGIAPEQLPLVFDKFWQLDSARTRTQSGIGMGLYIVRAFTELLGGGVRVSSVEGRGTEFTVALPAT